MSLKTWKEEFYAVPANEVAKEDAVSHSLRKWEGLRPANLEKHWVYWDYRGLTDLPGEVLRIDSNSCALCVHYLDNSIAAYEVDEDPPHMCSACPLAIARGDVPCDRCMRHEAHMEHPYAMGINPPHNPELMIAWLKKCLP